jgi:hypothetical protein
LLILLVVIVVVVLAAAPVAYAATSGVEQLRTGTNERLACPAACEQLQMRRIDVCVARVALDAARSDAEAATAAWAALTVVAIALSAVAVGLLFVPVIGQGWALLAGAAAAVAWLAANAALGVKLRKDANVSEAARALQRAQLVVIEALGILRGACSPADVDACLSRPTGC